MDTDFSYKTKTDAVIGSGFDVINEIGQMLNYLRITGQPVASILNI